MQRVEIIPSLIPDNVLNDLCATIVGAALEFYSDPKNRTALNEQLNSLHATEECNVTESNRMNPHKSEDE